MKTNLSKKTKVAIITCYKDSDYIRARTLRAGLLLIPNTEIVIIKNAHRNMLRYPEILLKLLLTRIKFNPDIYVLTFRGYEILPFLLMIARKKTVIFDEFINFIEWLVEHKKVTPNSIVTKIVTVWYRLLLKQCRRIITDTEQHSQLSAEITGINISRFYDIPVSADEEIFYPHRNSVSRQKDSIFQVLYYGNMLPLHGLKYVLDASLLLKTNIKIQLLIIGGNTKAEKQINDTMQKGANLIYKKWIPFADLPKTINSSNLCLGGPFGDTHQSQNIITGKTYQFLACQKAVLVGKNNATDAFKDKINSLLIPQADAKAIAESITWAYKHKKELENIAKSGRELYLSQFSIKKVSERLTLLIDQLK